MRIDETVDKETFKFHTELNDKLWSKDGVLNDGLREKLTRIGVMFFRSLKLPDKTKILDLTLTGSLAGYNYTSHSDLDIHVIIDYGTIALDEEFVLDYMKLKKDAWEEDNDISVYGYPVELFAQDFKQYKDSASPTFSLISNKWLVDFDKPAPEVDEETVTKKAEAIMSTIDSLEKSHDHKERLCMVKVIMNKIKRLRANGMDNGGDYSTENMIFKVIRNSGYLTKLMDIKSDAVKNIYTIK
jgi:hypothetical protein